MNRIRYRLVRAFWGTSAITLGLILVVVQPAFLMKLSPALSLTALALKMLIGVLFFAVGFLQYERASFPPRPPGEESVILDPVGNWLETQLADLKKRSWVLWFLALLVLMFSPILMSVFLPLILLRPFYATFTGPDPSAEKLWTELKLTGRFLFELAKGLLVLTICSCMALAVSVITLVIALYQLHQGP